MALFCIADLHLSFSADKPMDVFPGWDNYTSRLEKNWRAIVSPEDTVVLAGATNLALYAVYAEYTKTHTVGERVMDGKKFKKLTEHLLGGAGRAKLILDVAPDKLYAVGLAAVVAQALVKRLGAEKIVVSDKGVKEGYLQLVRSGSFRGAYYDFSKEPPAAGREEASFAAEPAQPKRRGRKPAAAKAEESEAKQPAKRGRKPAAAKAEEGEAKQPAKRGRKPAAAKPAAGAEQPSAQPKRRGRKPAAAKAKEGEAKQPARRGRPPKEKQEQGQEQGEQA